MTLYAVERIDDAVDMTRSFLTPVDPGRWARLTLVVVFLLGGTGGGGGASSAMTNFPATVGAAPEVGTDVAIDVPELSTMAVTAILGVVAVLFVLGLVVATVGAIMEFVFVESLSTDEIHVRRYFRRHAGNGVRLFGFRVLLGLSSLAILAGAFTLVFGDVVAGFLAGRVVVPSTGRIIAGLLVLVPLGIAIGVVVALLNGLTTEFIVPIMLREDRGVLSGWRRFWPTLRAQWKQYGAYLLIAFGLHILTGMAGAIVTGIAAIALAIPFLIVAIPVGLGALSSGSISAVAIALLVVLLVVYVLVVFLAAGAVYVPIKVFHRQFALLVLGDTKTAFDVLGERRPNPPA